MKTESPLENVSLGKKKNLSLILPELILQNGTKVQGYIYH